MKMRSVVLMVVLFLMVVGIAGVSAQDDVTETAAPTVEVTEVAAPPVEVTEIAPEPGEVVVIDNPVPVPDYSQLLPFATVIIVALLLAVVAIAGVAIVKVAALAPQWTVEAGYMALQEGFKEAVKYTKTTPTTLDDVAVEQLRVAVDDLKRQIDEMRAAQRIVG